MHLVDCTVEESLSRLMATHLAVVLREVLSVAHAVSELDPGEETWLSPMALSAQTVVAEEEVQEKMHLKTHAAAGWLGP
jgi:hypothetical protein